MIKVILFDADGFIIKEQKNFGQMYSEKYNVPIEKIEPFFKKWYGLCKTGKVDLKTKIKPYLKKWNWKDSVDEFLNLWFTSYTEFDNEVLDLIKGMKSHGVKCYLATNQEKYRAERIKNIIQSGNYLDGIFFSCDIGYMKQEREFFKVVIDSFKNIKPQEMLFWDSKDDSLKVAKSFGINTELYTSLKNFKRKMKEYNIK
ncbi:MAG TPA: HAD family hydrolase [Candidatus Paceibacterota bacterium]|jgi:putative hydrolase of the HAD superfamily|nr:HAD family hydrolase [Candidatus Paceibacterota bacterium]